MWDPQQHSLRMGTRLLLLTFILLSTCQVAESQALFTIRRVTLTLEPSKTVSRGTNVTVRCQALVSSSGFLNREYTIYKDNTVVYTKNTTTTEDLLYSLRMARVANTGKYKCKVNIQGKELSSNSEKLTVTGLQTPVLSIDKRVFSEGEEVTVWCTAPEESGAIVFYFYEDSKDLHEQMVNTNHVETRLRFNNAGDRKLHCDYRVILLPDSVRSNASNNVAVTVNELFITPVISVRPHGSKIIEGDNLDISCSVSGNLQNSSGLKVYLSKGLNLLSTGQSKANHSMRALAEHSGEFECSLEMGNVVKRATKNVTITELFSQPVLTIYPTEVFEREKLTLTCKSANYSSDRISAQDVKYTIYIDNYNLTPGSFNGIYVVPVGLRNLSGNYSCKADAKLISKYSAKLPVQAKVLVSKPDITANGRVIVGKPFQVRCHSDRGSLPIKYTLWKKYSEVNSTTVQQPHHQAVFPITIQHYSDIQDYKCEAQNNPKVDALVSNRLNTTVIVPLSNPGLTVLPDLSEVAEGDEMYLICGVEGSPPVTFKWYRRGNVQPLFTTTSTQSSASHQIKGVGNEHSGNYYCEAINYANMVQSQLVTVDVKMAMWKKGLIVACCLLVVAVLVLGCVLRYNSKRGKRENAAELSVKPSSPKSDDSLTVSLTHSTMEVYNPPKVGVDAAVSVWSERPVDPGSDVESSAASNNEPDVEYTEVVHRQPVDPARVPLRKGTETVYSEVQNSPTGAPGDHYDYGSVEYADLNGDQPEVNQALLEVNHQDNNDLPVPVE
ncbi:platelet endothelial cell adhesion molecule [Coregonus clupeaformis]|uniref:platelet endothelial cell adhesion molecule n=1 Tax=Coregonus clupeaformis TaxID=59861 RepID=UPI001E1C3E64|nr:platelet endothelial cell adhesion molecule [Coregonus clupeaformis]